MRFVSAVMVAGMLLSSCAAKSQSVSKTVIVPEELQSTYEQLQFAPAVRAGDFIYLSGVVASLKDGESAANITPAIERAFDEIELIMAEAGIDWSHAVDVTSYMTDIDNQLGPLWAVKGQRVPAPYPAWTAIGIDGLYGGEAALIEIKVTAYKPG